MIEIVPSEFNVLGLIPSTAEKKDKEEEKRRGLRKRTSTMTISGAQETFFTRKLNT